jgi:GNAT superfamily N-acetyltransferase
MFEDRPAMGYQHPAPETTGPCDRSRMQYTQHLATIGAPLYMRRATRTDFEVIARMIEDAKVRLRELGTDQWSTDWPDEAGKRRMDRMLRSIEKGKTWIGEFRSRDYSYPPELPAATVTIEEMGNRTVWSAAELAAYRAVYLSRLVVAEGLAGFHIGSAIIDWAGRRAFKNYGAQSIRIDVWTTNVALHNYYEKRGFEKRGLVPIEDYPAQQRFERPTSDETNLGPVIFD